MASVGELLERMERVDWGKVSDLYRRPGMFDRADKKWDFGNYLDLLGKAGVDLGGLLLDVGCGPVGFGSVYDETVGMDIQWPIVKYLRERGDRAVQGDLTSMEFDERSFDIVACTYPPVRVLKEAMPGTRDGAADAAGGRSCACDGGEPVAATWQEMFFQYAAPLARGSVVLHVVEDNDPGMGPGFLDFHRLCNPRQVPLKDSIRSYLYVVDKVQ